MSIKVGAQAYVRGSIEAVEMYCKAFGAEITFEIKNDKVSYAHSELSVDGQFFLNVSEASDDIDAKAPNERWTMTFNVYPFENEGAVQHAYDVLRDGGTVMHPLGAVPWSKCCASVIDKFGVFWWIGL